MNKKGASSEEAKTDLPNLLIGIDNLDSYYQFEDKFEFLEQPTSLPAHVAPAGQHVAPEILAAHTAWVKGSKEIAGLMFMTMEPEIQRNLENLHANDMLKIKSLILPASRA
ncbi:hypothetical protein Tco_0487657 [Tanacetum coccineum]